MRLSPCRSYVSEKIQKIQKNFSPTTPARRINIVSINPEKQQVNTMAKIKLASFVQSLHGRIGNIIYYNVNGYQYARSYTIPANPRTEGQQKNRARFAHAVKLWQQLSIEKKSIYNILVKDKPFSGYNLFISMTLKGITLETVTPVESIHIAVKVIPAIYQRANTSVSTGLYLPLTCNNPQFEVKYIKMPPDRPVQAA